MMKPGGRALDELGRLNPSKLNQTVNARLSSLGVRLWGISFIVERETAQTNS